MSQAVKTAILENDIEAQILEAILKERNVDFYIRSYHDGAYNGMFQTQKGWGAVFAPSEFREEIIQLLEDLRKAPE
ncbi:MAG: hypothetical protein WA118_07360 [Carboxydocellales bacterium]